MATSFTFGDQSVATRFFNGTCAAQFEVTESEFDDWADVVVEGDDGSSVTVAELAASSNDVRFDNAARQNAMAREFENNRFVDQVEGLWEAAADCRQRARDVSRQTFATV